MESGEVEENWKLLAPTSDEQANPNLKLKVEVF
jgi:hypothetical protein